MALELRQSLKLSQQLVMTPQLEQAIKLLQLSHLELQQAVREELEVNRALAEITEDFLEQEVQTDKDIANTTETREGLRNSDDDDDDVYDVFEKMNAGYYPGYLIPGRIPYYGYIPKDQAEWQCYFGEHIPLCEVYDLEDSFNYVNLITIIRHPTFAENLETQLRFLDIFGAEREIALYLIGNIDENGFLRTTADEAAQALSLPVEEVERAIATVQTLDPLGVGARDLRECLMIQARERGPAFELPLRILADHFDLFSTRDVAGATSRLKLPKENVKEAFQSLVTLWPKPGREYSGDDVQYITPDVYLFKVDDQWVITLNDDGHPPLCVSSYYRRLLTGDADGLPKEDQEFLKQKVKEAEWFIKCIEQRERTIYKVVESIVKLQRDFLETGPGHLRPLTLRDVAEDIEMHESTVSRVTSGKYVNTPHGIFELKYFFTSGLNREGGEEDIASKSVKEKIREIIRTEGEEKPLSDQELVRFLRNQGIQTPRRTVTKYRAAMGLLASLRRRKQY